MIEIKVNENSGIRIDKYLSNNTDFTRNKISDLIEPNWLIKKVTILNDIDKEMNRRHPYQGIKYSD